MASRLGASVEHAKIEWTNIRVSDGCNHWRVLEIHSLTLLLLLRVQISEVVGSMTEDGRANGQGHDVQNDERGECIPRGVGRTATCHKRC